MGTGGGLPHLFGRPRVLVSNGFRRDLYVFNRRDRRAFHPRIVRGQTPNGYPTAVNIVTVIIVYRCWKHTTHVDGCRATVNKTCRSPDGVPRPVAGGGCRNGRVPGRAPVSFGRRLHGLSNGPRRRQVSRSDGLRKGFGNGSIAGHGFLLTVLHTTSVSARRASQMDVLKNAENHTSGSAHMNNGTKGYFVETV